MNDAHDHLGRGGAVSGGRLMPALISVLLAGCALPPVDLAKVGLAPEDILAVEREGWKYNRASKGLPPQFRPFAVRNLRCVRPRHSFKNSYACDYLVDYGTAGSVAGTLSRKGNSFIRSDDGSWDEGILVRGS